MDEITYAREIFSFVKACSEVRVAEDFRSLIRINIRRLLQHDMAAYGVVALRGYCISRFINVDFPEDCARVIKNTNMARTIVKDWIHHRQPKLYTTQDLRALQLTEWLNAPCTQNVRNLAMHGVLDFSGMSVTYFVFGQLGADRAPDVTNGLQAIVPHLHATLSNVFLGVKGSYTSAPNVLDLAGLGIGTDAPVRDGTRRLSAREAEVLTWLYYGKRNSEIARALNTSVFTVKNHVQNILVKLGACNRTEAVSQALRAGLLPSKGSEHPDKAGQLSLPGPERPHRKK